MLVPRQMLLPRVHTLLLHVRDNSRECIATITHRQLESAEQNAILPCFCGVYGTNINTLQ